MDVPPSHGGHTNMSRVEALGHNGAGMLWVLAGGSAHVIWVRIHTRSCGGTGVGMSPTTRGEAHQRPRETSDVGCNPYVTGLLLRKAHWRLGDSCVVTPIVGGPHQSPLKDLLWITPSMGWLLGWDGIAIHPFLMMSWHCHTLFFKIAASSPFAVVGSVQ